MGVISRTSVMNQVLLLANVRTTFREEQQSLFAGERVRPAGGDSSLPANRYVLGSSPIMVAQGVLVL